MNASINTIVTGSNVSVQFGNDMGRERATFSQGTVLASEQRLGGAVYLIQDGSKVGIASIAENKNVVLHCTSALMLPTHAKTVEEAAYILGFKNYKAA